MKLLIKLYFSSEGKTPVEILPALRELGLLAVLGNYDLVKEFETEQEYFMIVENLHKVLKGSGVHYRLVSKKED